MYHGYSTSHSFAAVLAIYYFMMLKASCWSGRLDGRYVQEGHFAAFKTDPDCYDLQTAKRKCEEAADCGAIATQSTICGGKYRVTHGGPTLKTYSNWQRANMWAYTVDKNCNTQAAFADSPLPFSPYIIYYI